MRKLARYGYNLVIVLLLAVIIGQFVLPPAAEKASRTFFEKAFPGAVVSDAKIHAFPAVKLLTGSADGIEFEVSDFKVNNLNVSSLKVKALGLIWDYRQLFEGFNKFPEAETLNITALLSEKDLNRYLDTWVINGFNNPSIDLEASGALLKGEVQLLGRKFPIQVSGKFEAMEGSVWFQPDEIILEEQQLKADFSRELARGLGFKLPLNVLPGIEPAALALAKDNLGIQFQKKPNP